MRVATNVGLAKWTDSVICSGVLSGEYLPRWLKFKCENVQTYNGFQMSYDTSRGVRLPDDHFLQIPLGQNKKGDHGLDVLTLLIAIKKNSI